MWNASQSGMNHLTKERNYRSWSYVPGPIYQAQPSPAQPSPAFEGGEIKLGVLGVLIAPVSGMDGSGAI